MVGISKLYILVILFVSCFHYAITNRLNKIHVFVSYENIVLKFKFISAIIKCFMV